MTRIRGASGLGDAVYLAPIVKYFVDKGEKMTVCTHWPDVFRYIDCQTAPFTRQKPIIRAHYAFRKRFRETNQFQDMCIDAGITEPVEFRLPWETVNQPLVDSVREQGKPVCLVQMPRAPMGRKDGFGASILPRCEVIQAMINELKDRAYLVQVGGGKCLYKFNGIDLDLANKTSVTDLLDLALNADAMLGYPSNIIALAEAFDKPLMAVWSRRGLKDGHAYVRAISPKKILCKPTSRHVIDDKEWNLAGFCE